MAVFNTLVLAASLLFGYLRRDDAYALEVSIGIAGIALANIVARIAIFEPRYFWPTLLAGTIYRRRELRVSISYLIAIPVDETQLLVRGHRITTQYQPVGGVFKYRLSDSELSRRFNARPDSRFTRDQLSSSDLRLRLPGRDLHRLLRWFESRRDRELFPTREFYEELIATKILDQSDFPFTDCAYLGTRHLPLRYDRYSGLKQLIVGEIYELQPTERQLAALRRLRERHRYSPVEGIYFATREEIDRGGIVTGAQATFDIAPTASWLVKG
ncbi:hypothetical protein [Plantactinospora sp. WMMB782]|uniref:SMODS-associated NUDIX domain-containing protein n=1 Tax=Plantactinospora sp. WMMB782 TaxID=3404121 RepID=UPI003B95409B